ncbi:flagellar hook-basal body complex protein FliE [Orenia metallireducens]|jgi:flagellar hook-basal body complex protein FliE|uniref:Flagellar hook-basal body complex protein FliE n=1 Tax=Orenia metallireducens TaxID=1413210 RepID=A0A285FQZ8_9FIRM|nr:flagellar hook-basal body complex protein FliE [Orenia metallireducens]PRX33679.1 flagellar hook-basal body complex protein FliE [Orenia metallireducens]SNY13274.1 flagellar hook-basal body complex protein FliE [Orenia metallireducens]
MKVDNITNQSILKIDAFDNNQDSKRSSFTDMLKNSLQKVNKLQEASDKANQDLVLGRVDSIHEVMIAGQKAKTSLELTTAITRKAIDAYKEVMRIQV